MKRHILYLAMLALGTAATGCSDDDTAKEGRTEPTTVESISTVSYTHLTLPTILRV